MLRKHCRAVVHSVVSVTGFHRRPHYFDTIVFSTRLEIHIFQGKHLMHKKAEVKAKKRAQVKSFALLEKLEGIRGIRGLAFYA